MYLYIDRSVHCIVFCLQNQWSEMFPGIVAYVSSSNVISSGSSSLRDGLIQLVMTVIAFVHLYYVHFYHNRSHAYMPCVGLTDSVEFSSFCR